MFAISYLIRDLCRIIIFVKISSTINYCKNKQTIKGQKTNYLTQSIGQIFPKTKKLKTMDPIDRRMKKLFTNLRTIMD